MMPERGQGEAEEGEPGEAACAATLWIGGEEVAEAPHAVRPRSVGGEARRVAATEGEPEEAAYAATSGKGGVWMPVEAPRRARDVFDGGTSAAADAGAEVGATEASSRAAADEDGGGGGLEKCLASESKTQ